MPTATEFELEKSELNALLASGIFDRAPNLAQLLTYICSRYFEGQAEQIKEYNLAVEALGRSASFDQKRDSIVRVEAHLLRKRLREYYQNEGASHRVHIIVPLGQYAPKFLIQPGPEPIAVQPFQAVTPAVSAAVESEAPQTERFRARWPGTLIAISVALLAMGILAWISSRARRPRRALANTGGNADHGHTGSSNPRWGRQ